MRNKCIQCKKKSLKDKSNIQKMKTRLNKIKK